jgi:hypothetical protein
MNSLCSLHLFHDGPLPQAERRQARAESVARFHAVTAEAEERSLESLAQGAARAMAHRRRDPAAATLQNEVKRFRRMALACRERQQARRHA